MVGQTSTYYTSFPLAGFSPQISDMLILAE